MKALDLDGDINNKKTCIEEGDEREDDYDVEEEEEEKEDNFSSTATTAKKGEGGVVSLASMFSRKKNSENMGDDDDDDDDEKVGEGIIQDGIGVWNSFTKLKKSISNEKNAMGPILAQKPSEKFPNAYTCRDYQNWESVLVDVISSDSNIFSDIHQANKANRDYNANANKTSKITGHSEGCTATAAAAVEDKFVFSTRVRAAVESNISSVLLASQHATSQMLSGTFMPMSMRYVLSLNVLLLLYCYNC